jgi:hypothetical protein
MTKVKSFAVVLLAAATLASPALARGSHVTNDTRPKVSSNATLADGSTCVPAPRVGAFATAPWTNETPCEPNTDF